MRLISKTFLLLVLLLLYFLLIQKGASTPTLTLSFLILSISLFVLLNTHNKFTPAPFFSVFFVAYSFSGIYVSFPENLLSLRFINLAQLDIDVSRAIFNAQLQVLIAYIFSLIGFYLAKLIHIKSFNYSIRGFSFDSKLTRLLAILLFFTGFSYWLLMSFIFAGGPINMLRNIGVYEAHIKGSFSTAPYLLSIIGSYFIFLHYLGKKKIPLIVLVAIILTFLMLISKARVTGAFLYLSTFFIFYAIYFQIFFNFKKLSIALGLLCLPIIIYFLRAYSNFTAVDYDIGESFISYAGKALFGRGNVGDLQSLVLIKDLIEQKGVLLGRTFLDWTIPWINLIPSASLQTNSTGIRIWNEYFPNISGAPSPSIMAEMYLNWSYAGLSLGMLILGFLLQVLGRKFSYTNNKLNLFIYTKFLLFVFLLPKVDSTAIQSFIWSIILLIFFVSLALLLNYLINPQKR